MPGGLDEGCGLQKVLSAASTAVLEALLHGATDCCLLAAVNKWAARTVEHALWTVALTGVDNPLLLLLLMLLYTPQRP